MRTWCSDDRPQHDPAIFQAADLVLLTKTDLLDSTLQFDDLRLHRNLRGIGIDVVCEWLRAKEALQSLNVASRAIEPQPILEKTLMRYN